MAKPYLVKVKGLEDLANIAMAAQLFLIHRVNIDTKSIYYVPFPSYDAITIYYTEIDNKMIGKYLLFNRFTGEVQISDNYVNDSKHMVIPIVDVIEQEILPKDLIEKDRKERKKRSKSKLKTSGQQ